MTATYDPTLAAESDWVRFRIGDTNADDAQLSNEEINAMLEAATNKQIAAAWCLRALRIKWAAAGKGVLERKVDDLTIKRGSHESAADAIEAEISALLREGARAAGQRPIELRALGGAG